MATNKSYFRFRLVAAALTVIVVLSLLVNQLSTSPTQTESPESNGKQVGFRDVTRDSGIDFVMSFLTNEQGETFKINLYDHGCGVAVADYNGDGHDDIYFLNQLGPNALYRNDGTGHFTNVTRVAGVALADRICTGATFGDFDNDGDQDLYVTSTRGGNVMFRNRGDETFEDATVACQVSHVGHSQTAVFFDYDRDGWLDLYVLNTSNWTTDAYDAALQYFVGKGKIDGLVDVVESEVEENVLYRNNRDGTFHDVSDGSGLKGRGWSSDVAIFDYDDDGNLDVFVTSMFGPDQLYRNLGNGTFVDATSETLGPTSFGAIGCNLFDYDVDGRLDLIVVDMHSDMWMGLDYSHSSLSTAIEWESKKFEYFFGPYPETDPGMLEEETRLEDVLSFRHSDVRFGNMVYRNLGKGKFTEVSSETGLETFWPWGVVTADFDNDGFEDVFQSAGMGYPFYYWPNYLMRNLGNGTFEDVSEAAGIEPPKGGIYLQEKIQDRYAVRSSRCAATADFNGDGRLDLVVNNFNDRPYLFLNTYPQQNYVTLKLQGTESNRDAIGAVVKMYCGERVFVRQVRGAGGYLSQSTRNLHFGLGQLESIDRVQITWPGGNVQELASVEINSTHDISEPASQ